jgi:hypothetical protein
MGRGVKAVPLQCSPKSSGISHIRHFEDVENSGKGGKETFAAYCIEGRCERRSQWVNATHALKRSAGVSYPSVFRGRSLNCLATALSFA